MKVFVGTKTEQQGLYSLANGSLNLIEEPPYINLDELRYLAANLPHLNNAEAEMAAKYGIKPVYITPTR